MRAVRPMIAAVLAVFAITAHAEQQAQLNGITVEAERHREELEKKVHAFITSLMVNHHADWSNSRWTVPVCPMAMGLPADEAEFITAHMADAARAAGATLDGAKCSPNLVVFFTRDTDALLKEWLARSPALADDGHGLGPLHHFMKPPRPVRVLYHAHFFFRGIRGRLRYSAIRSLDAVVVLVDVNRLGNTNFRQLADYLSLVSLAEIDFDRQHGDTPTVLNLFSNPEGPAREGMSPWDRAFLTSLYSTNLDDQLQNVEMTQAMTAVLAPR
jgi:hypothetical protein